MRQTVVAVYDTYADAHSAQRALAGAGVTQAETAIYSTSADAPVERGPRVYAPGGGATHRSQPVLSQLERLFARLFKTGEYPPETEDYRECIRRGGTILSADVAETQVDMALDLMRRAGAADIEERASAWRKAGAASAATGADMHGTPAAAAEPVKVGGMQQVATHTEAHAPAQGMASPQRASGVPDAGIARTARDVDAGLKSRAAHSPDPRSRASQAEHATAARHAGDPLPGTSLDDDPYDDELRKDYEAYFAKTGASYDEYRRAYKHGTTLGQDERYRGSDWERVEPGARRDWESRYPESGWERFKAAVRYGWERVTRG